MRVTLTNGKDGELANDAVEKLRANFRGDVLVAGVPGYDESRRLFNAAIDRKPALVARCHSVADVLGAVQLARQNDVLVSVRGGGCDVAGTALAEGGFVIDLSRMTSVHVSAGKKSARVQAGATWAGVDRETHPFGLAVPGGSVAKVGVAGFTLGGGIGYLSRSYGLACDNLLSVDVVTAEGKLITASPSEHAELFWGLRGGGGNFGVVTSFEFQLHDVKPMLGGMAVFPLKQGREVLEAYRKLTQTAPDGLCAYAALVVHPEAGPVVAVAGCFNGNAVQGTELFAPVRALRPMVDAFRPLNYVELQGMLDPGAPAGFYHSWRSSFMQSISDKSIAVMLDQFALAPGLGCQVLIEQLGGAIARTGRDQSAYCHREAAFSLLVMGAAADAVAHKSAASWATQTWEALRPLSAEGVYVNYLSHGAQEATPERLRAVYDAPTMKRLAALKHKYDPTNFFRHNHNIKPAAELEVTTSRQTGIEDDVRRQLEALSTRFNALEDRINELEFEATLTDKGKKKAVT